MKRLRAIIELVVMAAILTGILMLARCPVEPEAAQGWEQVDFEPGTAGRGR